jgi:hypothetical protein
MDNIKDNSSIDKKKVIQRDILYKWESDMRTYKKLDKKKFWMVSAAVLVLFVVLAILGQFGLMAAVAAVMFLFYVLGTVPPEKVSHLITTLGVETMDKEYKWEKLQDYWFSKKDGAIVLNVDTSLTFPSRLIMITDKGGMDNIHGLLKDKLKYRDFRDQSSLSRVSEGEWINLLEQKSAK